MPASDPLTILLAHDRWATTQLLDACAALPPEQFHQRFDIGPGNLHDTLTHVIGAMRAWTDTLAGAEPRPRIETDGQRRTPETLRAMLNEACTAFAAEARRLPLDESATRTMKTGERATFTRGAILMQVLTHGMHHRAQCLNMLKQLGVSPLPPSSVTEWVWLGEGPGRSQE